MSCIKSWLKSQAESIGKKLLRAVTLGKVACFGTDWKNISENISPSWKSRMICLDSALESPLSSVLHKKLKKFLHVLALDAYNDGETDAVKKMPPNPLRHLIPEQNMQNHKEQKIEMEHEKLPKGRAAEFQKMKQSKLVIIIYLSVLLCIFAYCAISCLKIENQIYGWPYEC